ncbi:MAG: ABC transporter [Deltaproteobacteria bacterium]|nr:ABC transporter [Deltaproteobacteria bacterium]
MPVIDATNLRKIVADRTLFEEASLTIRRGEKVGLVGRNGSGKTTLARVLAGFDEPDAGRVARRRGATVEYLAQEPRFAKGRSVREVVLESLAEWNETKRRFDVLTDELASATDPTEQARLAGEQAEVGETLERQGGWERAYEAEAIVGHLGISDAGRCVDTLSGGEARRVALARLLVAAPDLAILDEPTNHLDIETIEWLEEFLRDRFEGAILLISHDRRVLDAVTSRTFEIHDGLLDVYDGGYARYLEVKAAREVHAERVERNRQNFLRREVEWLRRQPKARGTKQKARISRAEAALDQSAPAAERTAVLRASSERLGKTILETKGLVVERGGRCLIDGLDLALRPGERIGIVGVNGAGKTSLLLAIQGELEPVGGEILIGSNTRIGYLDQSRAGLDSEETLREAAVGDASEIELGEEKLSVGSYLERFLFDRRQQRLRVGELSGGERGRVCLARLLSRRCNLLLLDEPTNDLDVATLGALESMLVDFGGSALIVSHDRWLLDRVATSILAFEGEGRVELHAGGYEDYRERRSRPKRAEVAAPSSTQQAVSTPVPPKSRPAASSASAAKKLTHAERRELDGLFEEIDAAEARAGQLQERLADPSTYQGGGDEVAALRAELESALSDAARLTARWEELEARDAASRSS